MNAKTSPAPRAWKDVYDETKLTEDEQRALDEAAGERRGREAELTGTAPVPKREAEDAVEDPETIPEWAHVPDPRSGFRFPKGKRVIFVRIRADLTDAPDKGDRDVVIWTLSDGEENHATKRAAGDSSRTYKEMTKQMIRSIDGHKVDWSGSASPGNIARFWEEIGPVARTLLVNVYHRTHAPKQEVILDFFINCFAARSAVAG